MMGVVDIGIHVQLGGIEDIAMKDGVR